MQKTECKTEYAKILSTLFCSNAIIALSILCLLNNLSLDMYTVIALIKVVAPAAFCFWFIGNIIGTILDKYNKKIVQYTKTEEAKAYEIPSIFSDGVVDSLDENNE